MSYSVVTGKTSSLDPFYNKLVVQDILVTNLDDDTSFVYLPCAKEPVEWNIERARHVLPGVAAGPERPAARREQMSGERFERPGSAPARCPA